MVAKGRSSEITPVLFSARHVWHYEMEITGMLTVGIQIEGHSEAEYSGMKRRPPEMHALLRVILCRHRQGPHIYVFCAVLLKSSMT